MKKEFGKSKTFEIILSVLLVIMLTEVLVVACLFVNGNLSKSDPTIEITPEQKATEVTTIEDFDYDDLAKKLSNLEEKAVPASVLKHLDSTALEKLKNNADQGVLMSTEQWHSITGYTLNALLDKYGTMSARDMGNNGKESFVLGFTGDINFEDTNNFYVMQYALTKENVVLDCIDEKFQEEMKAADIMLINNEFTYTTRGTPTPGKTYHFRANPDYVKYLTAMGVDIVSLANNHTYDYGYDSFVDTIDTLENADIEYVGAGMNETEANAPATFLMNGYKIGYIACSGVDETFTPVATADSVGTMGSYDDGETVANAIKEAKKTCDYVIVYPHWGNENTTVLSSAQKSNGKLWIDAGADIIIGNHAHNLQGMEFYKGKLIVYSLGNFWFNSRTRDTGLLKLTIDSNGITPSFVPGVQDAREAKYASDPDKQRAIFDRIESYEPATNVAITDDGVIYDKTKAN